MKTLLALLLLIPSLSWGDKIAFRCNNLDGYFILDKGLLKTKLTQFFDNGSIHYYEEDFDNEVFIYFKQKKIENNGKTDDKNFQLLMTTILNEQKPLKYNKLSKTLSRKETIYYCYPYDLNS